MTKQFLKEHGYQDTVEKMTNKDAEELFKKHITSNFKFVSLITGNNQLRESFLANSMFLENFDIVYELYRYVKDADPRNSHRYAVLLRNFALTLDDDLSREGKKQRIYD